MKLRALYLKILFLLIYSTAMNAEEFSSFSADQFYSLEGRWLSAQDKNIFLVNEGNANEERITIDTRSENLVNKVKYKLCLKIKTNCQLNCHADVIRMVKLLLPWEDATPITPRANGSYVETKAKDCNEGL